MSALDNGIVFDAVFIGALGALALLWAGCMAARRCVRRHIRDAELTRR
jgi:hypothetical protein